MRPQSTSLRAGMEGGMRQEAASIRESSSEQAFDSALDAKLKHDLLVWPRQLLEAYLKRHPGGHIPLNEARLRDALESAYETSEQLLHSAIEPPLIDSGVYVGTITWEGHEVLLQRISPPHAIVHSKALLHEIPHSGEFVGITDLDGSGSVRESRRRTTSRDVGR
jgi:hypothetical protein